MRDAIRGYAIEQLDASGEGNEVRRAHAAYWLVLAEEGDASFTGSERALWLARFDAEHDNFRQALDWLVANGGAEGGPPPWGAPVPHLEGPGNLGGGPPRPGTGLGLPGAPGRPEGR